MIVEKLKDPEMLRIFQRQDFTKPKDKNKIGTGGFGDVYKITEKATGQEYAVKILRKEDQTDLPENFLHEINILSQLHYPTLLSLHGITLDFPYYCLTEFLPNKSVQYYIEKAFKGQQEHFDDTQKFIIILGVAFGMNYLHSKDIVHRDLKPLNILLDSNFYPRICDFGLSKVITNSAAKTFTGTIQYCAPEIFSTRDETGYDGKKADVYSYGMTLYSILYETNPFSEITNEFGIIGAVMKGDRPILTNNHPSSINELISSCWDPEPKKRPEFSRIIEELKSGRIKISEEELNIEEINKFIKYCEEEEKKIQNDNIESNSKSKITLKQDDYLQSAENENSHALNNIEILYENGEVVQNLNQAALKGNQIAQTISSWRSRGIPRWIGLIVWGLFALAGFSIFTPIFPLWIERALFISVACITALLLYIILF